ncbi:MAG: DUF11 domain-containing protein [Chloroflexi bacterium]|nr:DUF11 domain-containing protein [Chloroflexota bacterium]
MGVYFSASDYGDIQADTESDFSASLGSRFSQMRGSEQSALWLRSGADVSLETDPRNQDTSDNGLQVLVNGSWQHPEAVSLNAGATYQFRVHVNDPTWNSAYVRAWADWNGTSGGGVYRIDSFGDARRSSGWYTFNVTIPNDAQSISWLRTHVAHEPTDGPNQFTYNYPTGARWVTGEIEDYRLSIVRGTDLSITKTDAPDPVKMGEQLVWTLQVRNNGPSEAINVTVQDTIPAGLTYETSSGDYSCSHTSSIDCPFSSLAVNESRIMPISGFSCSHTPSTRSIDCSLSSLAVNESRTIQITVFVPTGYSSNQISNTAIVSSSSLELNPDDNQDTEITTVISEADLFIIKTDSPDPVMAGNQLTWTLGVRNDGPADALNVIVRDTIPANLTFVSATSALFNCNYNSGAREVICTSSASSGALGVGQTASISLVVNVPPNYAANSITNTASVFTTTDDPDPSNDQDTEITTIEKRADLSIVKTDTPDPALAGNTLQYSLSVTNNGPSTADNVVVSDVLPNGTTYQNVFGPADWNCNYNGGARSISCTKPSMDVGETALINLSLQVDSDYPGNSISNTGRITSDTTDPDLGDNQDTEITTVEKRADLSITKSDTPDPVAPGEVIRYALSVSNNGPSDAINARVTDTLPPGLLYVGTSPPAGWSCDYQAATRTLTCSISRLVVGATADIMLDVSVPSTYPGGGTISNTAVTTSDTPDPNPGDNQDTEDTSVSIVWGVSPPSGYVFTHIRVDNELNPGAQDQKDYLADEYIPGHLQVPVEMGMAFHTDSPPSLCTTNVTPCPATELVEGTVMVESFAVTEVENLKTNEIKVFSTGSDVTMNRYSEPSIPACTLGRCVAFGSFLAPNYVWADPDEYVYLYWQHPDGEPLECPAGYQCWTIPDSEPGYYAVRGTVALIVDFPGYPELRRTYTLDGTANYEIIASFAQPSSR